MGVNFFYLDGVSSLDYGIVIERARAFDAPARSYETVAVPGRNGAILFDNGYYENVQITYECVMLNKNNNLDTFRSWLLSHTGYVKLADTYHPTEYRMAVFSGQFSATTEARLNVARFTLTFSAKPQRWINSGDVGKTFTADGSLYNPTNHNARPLIRVYGYGDLGIGDDTITIAENSLSYIDIDSETCDAFCGSTNANGYITLSGDDFPVLEPGPNGVVLDSTITSVVVYPHWWCL